MKHLKKYCLAIFLPPWGACGGSDDSSCCWLPEAVRFSNSARSDVKFLTSEVVRQLFGGNGGDRTKVRPAAVEAAEAGWTGSGAYVKPVKKIPFWNNINKYFIRYISQQLKDSYQSAVIMSWVPSSSWLDCLQTDSEVFILFAEISEIFLRNFFIIILLIFIYLVALNLLLSCKNYCRYSGISI